MEKINPEVIGSVVWKKGLRYCTAKTEDVPPAWILERFESSLEPLRVFGIKFSGTIKNVRVDDEIFKSVRSWDTKTVPGWIIEKPISTIILIALGVVGYEAITFLFCGGK